MLEQSYQWGSFCSHCGEALGGDFPRSCSRGHITHDNDKEGVMVMQPVALRNDRVALLTVRRNIAPFIGGLAMVSGHKDKTQNFETVLRHEIHDETGLVYPDHVRFKYHDDYIVPPHDPDFDGRSFHITVFEAPMIGLDQIDFTYTHAEVQELGVAIYDSHRKTLYDFMENDVTMAFKNHQRLALEFFAEPRVIHLQPQHANLRDKKGYTL